MEEVRSFLSELGLLEYYSKITGELEIRCMDDFDHLKKKDLKEIGMPRPSRGKLLKALQKRETLVDKLIKKTPLKYFFEDKKSADKRNALSPTTPIKELSKPVNHTLTGSSPAPRKETFQFYVDPDKESVVPKQRHPSQISPAFLLCAEDIEFKERKGEGQYGVVFHAVWITESGTPKDVAVKCLREELTSCVRSLGKEVEVMGRISHENIIQFYGLVLKTGSMVFEYAPLGALDEFLQRRRYSLSSLTLFNYCTQLLEALAYLKREHLVHRDIAARNMLMMSPDKVKLGDFGLSRILPEDDGAVYTMMSVTDKMPYAWCAPESLSDQVFSPASDMWMFGVTVWEIFSFCQRPWKTKKPLAVLRDTECGVRLDRPAHCPPSLYKHILLPLCWNIDPKAREDACRLTVIWKKHQPIRGDAKFSHDPSTSPTVILTSSEYPHIWVAEHDSLTALEETYHDAWLFQNETTEAIGLAPSRIFAPHTSSSLITSLSSQPALSPHSPHATLNLSAPSPPSLPALSPPSPPAPSPPSLLTAPHTPSPPSPPAPPHAPSLSAEHLVEVSDVLSQPHSLARHSIADISSIPLRNTDPSSGAIVSQDNPMPLYESDNDNLSAPSSLQLYSMDYHGDTQQRDTHLQCTNDDSAIPFSCRPEYDINAKSPFHFCDVSQPLSICTSTKIKPIKTSRHYHSEADSDISEETKQDWEVVSKDLETYIPIPCRPRPSLYSTIFGLGRVPFVAPEPVTNQQSRDDSSLPNKKETIDVAQKSMSSHSLSSEHQVHPESSTQLCPTDSVKSALNLCLGLIC